MKLDRSNFSLVMQDFTTFVRAPFMLSMAASARARCSGVILLVSIAGIWPPTTDDVVISQRPISIAERGV